MRVRRAAVGTIIALLLASLLASTGHATASSSPSLTAVATVKPTEANVRHAAGRQHDGESVLSQLLIVVVILGTLATVMMWTGSRIRRVGAPQP